MSDRRRVLVVNHYAAPIGEAGGTRHVELFSRLGGSWEYLIIASDLNPQTGRRMSSSPGFSVVRVPRYSDNGARRVLNWLVYAWRAIRLGVRQRHVSVVYGSSPHLMAALAAWFISVVKRCPFVLEVRDLWPRILVEMGTLEARSPIYRILSALERFLYARADSIVVLARGTEDDLLERGIGREKISYIPNGPDPKDFVPTRSRAELREAFGFDRFTAIYTGAHGPANGLDLALDAAAEVAGDEIDIVLVGGGIEKDRLVARASAEGITRVRFLDPVPKSSIPELLAAADVGLHVLADVPLFQTAVSPNKVFDYMAAGLPVITNVPGTISDLVDRVGAGFVASPTGIAGSLRVAAAEPASSLRSRGELGREYILAHQSRSQMAVRLRRVLEGRTHSARGPAHLLIDLANQRAGGGLQVATTLVESIESASSCTLVCASGSPLATMGRQRGLSVVERSDSKLGRVWRAFGPRRLVNRDLVADVALTLFGTPLRGGRIPIRVAGVAYSNLFYPEVDFWKNESAPRRLMRRARDAARLRGLERADGLIFETRALATRALAQHPTWRRKPILISPPSPRPEFARLSSGGPRRMRDEPRILLAAGWHPNKNLDRIPAVAAALICSGLIPEFVFTLDSESTGGAWLRREGERLGVADHLTFVGRVAPENMPDLVVGCDVVLLISELESFSNNVIEAFATGTPLVVSDRDWARASCGPGAAYCDPNDTDDIARTISAVVEDDLFRARLVSSGAKVLETDFLPPVPRTRQLLAFCARVAGLEESAR